jgi:hypothetical protein
MFLPYALEDNIEKKTELDVVLNESLNTNYWQEFLFLRGS